MITTWTMDTEQSSDVVTGDGNELMQDSSNNDNEAERKPQLDQTCPICGKVWNKPSLLKQHMRVHTGEKPFRCVICNKRFSQKGHLRTHQKIHLRDDPSHAKAQTPPNAPRLVDEKAERKPQLDRTCTICSRICALPYLMKQHMRVHTGEKPYECSICNRRFSLRSNLQKHHQNMHVKKHSSATCPICGTTPSHMKRHMRTHTGEKPYECPVCNRRFSLTSNLQRHHQNVHVKKKKHSSASEKSKRKELTCPICGKGCKTPTLLKRHMRIHTGEKPYECTICNRRFSKSGNLQCHQKLHIRDISSLGKDLPGRTCKCHSPAHYVPYPAVESGDGANCSDSDGETVDHETPPLIDEIKPPLDTHPSWLRQRTHAAEKPCECVICSQSCTQEESLPRHYKTHAKLQLNQMCGTSFNMPLQLRRHATKPTGGEPYKCKVCHTRFNKRGHLRAHQKMHMEDYSSQVPVTCKLCGKRFTTISYLVCHSFTHKYDHLKCVICGKRFPNRRILRCHLPVCEKQPPVCKRHGKTCSFEPTLDCGTKLPEKLQKTKTQCKSDAPHESHTVPRASSHRVSATPAALHSRVGSHSKTCVL